MASGRGGAWGWSRGWRTVTAAAVVALGAPAGALAADEALDPATFDPATFEPRPYELGGFAELRAGLLDLDAASLQPTPATALPIGGPYAAMAPTDVQVVGSWRTGPATVAGRLSTSLRPEVGGWRAGLRLFEGGFTLKPATAVSIDLGKKVLRWGKGYAWNPVAFVSRPKDPNDPELPLDGYALAGAEAIRSFDGPLQTLALSAVALPVLGAINPELGGPERLIAAGKLYVLLADTDLDVMAIADGATAPRFGIDFSRNLASNVEVHGEWGYHMDASRVLVDGSGPPRLARGPAHDALLGVRWLTAAETTWIGEYYYHGAGYAPAALADYYQLVASSRAAPADPTLAAQAHAVGAGGLAAPNPQRHYGYLRVFQKEPFGILDLVPAATAIASLEDGSFMLVPELTYTGLTNFELRLRVGLNVGAARTEFGERPADRLAEGRVRYYF